MTPLLVALGAAVGAPTRYVLGRLLDGRLHQGTLLVNLVGSLVLGLLVGAGVSGSAMALLGVGFCGGLTTYSSFSVQTVLSERRPAAVYVALSIPGCLLAAALGYAGAHLLS